jgi:hypothetical protein
MHIPPYFELCTVMGELPLLYISLNNLIYKLPTTSILNLNLTAIDIFHNMFYSTYNIPTKPLPQGMRNMVGFFVLGVE